NLPELRRRMTAALDSINGETWELILVDDGSRDRSFDIVRQMHADDPRIKLIHLSRNFGHQPAVTAGIHHARGDCVVLIDGDLQDPPEVIPEMVAKWKQGFQVVLGERHSRGDVSGARGIGFTLFYPIFPFGLGLFYVITFFTMHKQVTGFTTTIVSVLFLGGVQLISIGILGEYIGRIYEEMKQRPLYVVQEKIGFDR